MSTRLYLPSRNVKNNGIVSGLVVGGISLLVLAIVLGIFLGSPDRRICEARLMVKQKAQQIQQRIHNAANFSMTNDRVKRHCHKHLLSGKMVCHQHKMHKRQHKHVEKDLGEVVRVS